mmetsp:Transcript_14209/g.20189  ORF Transcript_14209/g.20189 Transcript_14209/m.20189 type:complete len:84 (-) Transcript_14209:283-534(-)
MVYCFLQYEAPRERNYRGHGSFTGGRSRGGGRGRNDFRPRGGGRGNRGGGRNGGGRAPRESKPQATAEDLDAEMDAYFASKGE